MEFVQNIFKKIRCHYFLSIFLLMMGNVVYAQTIIIQPNMVITHSKTYNNVTLDLSSGSFIVKNGATLTINNSTIMGTLSQTNPVLITIDKGKLTLNNNNAIITAANVSPHPLTQSLYHMIQMGEGGLNMTGNTFSIDKPFAAGLLVTTASIPTTGFQIVNNKFNGFHGVLYLIASDNALVANNVFTKNTYGHIVMISNNSKINRNVIYFSGNNRLGNAMDIIDSNNITILGNQLLTPTCHGIYVLNSSNLLIDSNRISGGITYAMTILTYPEVSTMSQYVNELVTKHKMKNNVSTNVTITNNYMSQNRYGIAASDVNGLNVKNNTFIQWFDDVASRKFWTNNNVLLQNVSNLNWTSNIYKEAFTQVNGGDNSNGRKFVTFPETGGVSL